MGRLAAHNRSRALSVDEAALQRYFDRVLPALKVGRGATADVAFVGRAAIRRLKREHFGVAMSTDCVTFGVDMGEMPGGVRYLGEIVLCPEVIRENAARHRTSFDREMMFVFTHGVLHLLGWDDATPRERERMFARQDRLLGRFGPRRPVFGWRRR
jgi:probable rRNA maturation factor